MKASLLSNRGLVRIKIDLVRISYELFHLEQSCLPRGVLSLLMQSILSNNRKTINAFLITQNISISTSPFLFAPLPFRVFDTLVMGDMSALKRYWCRVQYEMMKAAFGFIPDTNSTYKITLLIATLLINESLMRFFYRVGKIYTSYL